VRAGMSARFEATFAGNPPPTVTWMKEGEELKNSKKIQIRTKDFRTTMTVIDVNDDDAGTYICKVANEIGADTSRASLTITREKMVNQFA